MRESKIEAYLRKRIEARGGRCYKFVSPGRKNVPDRLVLMPVGDTEDHKKFKDIFTLRVDDYEDEFWHFIWALSRTVIFVELKAPGKKPTPGQLREHERLRGLGFRVEVLDSIRAVEDFVDGL